MNFTFDTDIIYPHDPTATAQRIEQYKKYYPVKYMICKLCNPETIAEIGIRAGYSLWTFLQACPKARAYGFDANNGMHGGKGGENGDYWRWAKNILKDYNVKYTKLDTQTVEQLPIEEKVDFLHIDGDHSFKGVLHDINLARKAVKIGGYILIDDFDYLKEVREAVEYYIYTKKEYIYLPSLRGEILIRNIDGEKKKQIKKHL